MNIFFGSFLLKSRKTESTSDKNQNNKWDQKPIRFASKLKFLLVFTTCSYHIYQKQANECFSAQIILSGEGELWLMNLCFRFLAPDHRRRMLLSNCLARIADRLEESLHQVNNFLLFVCFVWSWLVCFCFATLSEETLHVVRNYYNSNPSNSPSPVIYILWFSLSQGVGSAWIWGGGSHAEDEGNPRAAAPKWAIC